MQEYKGETKLVIWPWAIWPPTDNPQISNELSIPWIIPNHLSSTRNLTNNCFHFRNSCEFLYN